MAWLSRQEGDQFRCKNEPDPLKPIADSFPSRRHLTL